MSWARTRRLGPAMRTLPVSTVPTCNWSPIDADVLLPVAQLRGGVPCDDAHARHLGERVDQFFGEAVAEIFVLRFAAEIGEGQHRHGDDAGVLAHGLTADGLARRIAQCQTRRVAARDELDEHRIGAAIAFVIGLQLGA